MTRGITGNLPPLRATQNHLTNRSEDLNCGAGRNKTQPTFGGERLRKEISNRWLLQKFGPCRLHVPVSTNSTLAGNPDGLIRRHNYSLCGNGRADQRHAQAQDRR